MSTIEDSVAYSFVVLIFLLVGLSHLGDPSGSSLGLAIGVLSATAWALSTLPEISHYWTNKLNFFAAVFAACSLGYLAPLDQLYAKGPGLPLCQFHHCVTDLPQVPSYSDFITRTNPPKE